MGSGFIARQRNRDYPRCLVICAVAVAVMTSVPACAVVDKIDKLSKTPGLEEAQLREGLKKTRGRIVRDGSLSPLQAAPSVVDFGRAPVASESQKTIVISSPFGFAVTVVQVIVQGCDGFALSGQAGDRPIIPPHGQLTLNVTFKPAAPRVCSGHLLLEIDSAGPRFTRVALKGRGISS
jgi:hypothetical protein